MYFRNWGNRSEKFATISYYYKKIFIILLNLNNGHNSRNVQLNNFMSTHTAGFQSPTRTPTYIH